MIRICCFDIRTKVFAQCVVDIGDNVHRKYKYNPNVTKFCVTLQLVFDIVF